MAIRYALRSLLHARGFTTVALLTLALGIGLTTAIFSVVDAILLRPLAFPEPSHVVSLSRTNANGVVSDAFSAADYLDYRRAARSFTALAGYREQIVDLTADRDPVRLSALETTAAFFDVYRAPALHGRTYAERTDSPTGPRVAVLAEGAWRRVFGADAALVGREIRLDGSVVTVAGIVPASFVYPAAVDVWLLAPRDVPTSPLPDDSPRAAREVQYFQVVARLAPGISIDQANSDLAAVTARLAADFPDTARNQVVRVTEYHDTLVGDVRRGLLLLLGAVGVVLLIACANVAGLLLARGTARRREFALRSALGASRGRLLGDLLMESLVLAGLGGLLGLVVAYWGVQALVALAPESIPRVGEVGIDPRVMGFTLAISAAVGVLFGLAPAVSGARRDAAETLKDGGRTGTARSRVQQVLVVAEVALALVLLIGAGLLLTSFSRLRGVDPGFVAEHLTLVGVPLPQARYDAPAQRAFYTRLLETLQQQPATARAALAFPAPFSGANAAGGYTVEGRTIERGARPLAQLTAISPGYFQTMGIRLLRGRDLEVRDHTATPGVALVNQTLAEREWPNQDPLGKRLVIGASEGDAASWLTVIGVVADSKRDSLQLASSPAIYLSHHVLTLPFMGVLVRSDADVAAVQAAVRVAIHALDPALPVDNATSLDRVLEQATGQPRFRALLVAVFAGAALVLAAVGLYGLISYSVAQRGSEIGVRLALGATPWQVGRAVIGHGLLLGGCGVAIGIATALAGTRLLDGLLFAVSANDPWVYGGLTLTLLAITVLACMVPARRAMHVDPVTALRNE